MIYILRISLLWRASIKRTDRLILANSQNEWIIPRKYRYKIIIRQIGWHNKAREIEADQNKKPTLIKFLWCGRLHKWKGLEVALRAYAALIKNNKENLGYHFDVIGKGPDSKYFKELAK